MDMYLPAYWGLGILRGTLQSSARWLTLTNKKKSGLKRNKIKCHKKQLVKLTCDERHVFTKSVSWNQIYTIYSQDEALVVVIKFKVRKPWLNIQAAASSLAMMTSLLDSFLAILWSLKLLPPYHLFFFSIWISKFIVRGSESAKRIFIVCDNHVILWSRRKNLTHFTYIWTCTHVYPHTLTYEHISMYTLTHFTYIQTRTHVYIHTHTYKHVHMYTLTHTSHTYEHICMHTLTHTSSCKLTGYLRKESIRNF